MIIKILGSCCKNCDTLFNNTKSALDEMGLSAEVIKVTDFNEITTYGVMSIPALIIDKKVVSVGKALKTKEICKILEEMQ